MYVVQYVHTGAFGAVGVCGVGNGPAPRNLISLLLGLELLLLQWKPQQKRGLIFDQPTKLSLSSTIARPASTAEPSVSFVIVCEV